MIDTTIQLNHFQTLLEKLFNETIQTDYLQKIRLKGWDHFLELGLPTPQTDVYRTFPLRKLFAQNLNLPNPISNHDISLKDHIYPECLSSYLVFVNGLYCPHLSDIKGLNNKVIILPLSEATKTYGTFLNNQWAKSMMEETDSFAALNAALHQDGLFIYIPPKNLITTPIQILNIIKSDSHPLFINPRLHIFVGSHAQASIITSEVSSTDSSYFLNHVSDINLDEGAHLHLTQKNSNNQEINAINWHFDALRCTLKRNSVLKSVLFTQGGLSSRHDYRIILAGENAEASLNGLCMLTGNKEAHTNILIDHQAPHCRSWQLFKGVLDGFSRSSFEGKILVRQVAQKTDAFQLNNNLLISDRAQVTTKPNLEIFDGDVKASHGATIGSFDTDQLFYMQARGLSDQLAKTFLIRGYCQEIFDLISIPSLKELLIRQTQTYLA